MNGTNLNEVQTESRAMSIYQNFVPISLLAVVVPVIVMGVSAYFSSQANSEKIEILRQDRQKFDLRIADRLNRLDDKLDSVALLLERTSTRVEAIDTKVQNISDEQKRSTKAYEK